MKTEKEEMEEVEDKNARLKLLEQLNNLLSLAQECFDDSNYKFSKRTFYGSIWIDVMNYISKTITDIDDEQLTRKIYKVFTLSKSIYSLRNAKSYFEPDYETWKEKVRNLFSEIKEDKFDSLCYESHIGMVSKKKLFPVSSTGSGQSPEKGKKEEAWLK